MKKKYLAYILTFALLFTSLTGPLAFAKGDETGEEGTVRNTVTQEGDRRVKPARTPQEPVRSGRHAYRDKTANRSHTPYRADEQVRVIIELKKAALLDEAAQTGRTLRSYSKGELAQASQKRLQDQSILRQELTKAGITLKEKGEINQKEAKADFTLALNGFSTYVAYRDIARIRKNPKVKAVYLVNQYQRPAKPSMYSSLDIIGLTPEIRSQYTGIGRLVAVLDTGIDASHKAMQGLSIPKDSTVQPKYNEASMKQAIVDYKLPGQYVNEKVVYSYNYSDQCQIGKDVGADGQHGMHVAGTIAGNEMAGDPSHQEGTPWDNGDQPFMGVAPNAQLLNMKVFSNEFQNGSTYADSYIEAIDDAVALGADSINMSLGSSAGRFMPNNAEALAVAKARKAGVLVAIAAGNDSTIMDGAEDYITHGTNLPLAGNVDIGLVGSPSTIAGSLSVASYENTKLFAPGLRYTLEDQAEQKAKILPATGAPVPHEVLGDTVYTEQDVIEVGAGVPFEEAPGKAADWTGVDAKDKIVFVQRGNSFLDTLANAEKAQAKAIIIYNNDRGEERDSLVSMVGGDGAHIPYIFMGHTAGQAICEALKNGKKVQLVFPAGSFQWDNEDSRKMSSFTSWGPTPDLEIKPEITGPGGRIYSTQNDGKYTDMSGTSMATPHVAGGIALVNERLAKLTADAGYQAFYQAFKTLRGFTDDESAQADLAKTILMNTAKPIPFYSKDGKDDRFYFVRQQGAGMMNIPSAALTEQVLLTQKEGAPKVELKSFQEKSFTMKLRVYNWSAETVDYQVKVDLMKDHFATIGDDPTLYNMKEPEIMKASLEDKVVSVSPKSYSDFDLPVSFDQDAIAKNNFVEGFVRLEALTKGKENLVLPVLGFYGDWEALPLVDRFHSAMWNEDPNTWPTFGETMPIQSGIILDGVKDVNEGWRDCNWVDDQYPLYINPEKDPVKDSDLLSSHSAGLKASLLRNIDNMTFQIVKEPKGQVLRTLLGNFEGVKENSMYAGNYAAHEFLDAMWDGTIDGKPLATNEEVTYQVRMQRTAGQDESLDQYLTYPIVGDNDAPFLVGEPTIDQDNQIHFQANDALSGMDYVNIYHIDKDQYDKNGQNIWAADTDEFGFYKWMANDERFLKLTYGDPEADGAWAKKNNFVIDPGLNYKNDTPEGQPQSYSADLTPILTNQEDNYLLIYGVDMAGNTFQKLIEIKKDQVKEDKMLPDPGDPGEDPSEPTPTPKEGPFGQAQIEVSDPGKLWGYNYQSEYQTPYIAGRTFGFRALDQILIDYYAKNPDGTYQKDAQGQMTSVPVASYIAADEGSENLKKSTEDVKSEEGSLLYHGPVWRFDTMEDWTAKRFETGFYYLRFTVKPADTEDQPLTIARPFWVDRENVTYNKDNPNFQVNGTGYSSDPKDGYVKYEDLSDQFMDASGNPVATKDMTVHEKAEKVIYTDKPDATIAFSVFDNFAIIRTNRDDDFVSAIYQDNMGSEEGNRGLDYKNVTMQVKDQVNLKIGENKLDYISTDIGDNTKAMTLTIVLVNKDVLRFLVEQTEQLPEEQMTPELKDALEKAKDVLAKENASTAEVKEAEDKLLDLLKPILHLDEVKPILSVADRLTYKIGATIDEKELLSKAQAQDLFGNDLSDQIKVDPTSLPSDQVGEYTVTYSVTDKAGKTTTKQVIVQIVADPLQVDVLTAVTEVAKSLKKDHYTSETYQPLAEAIQKAEEMLEKANAYNKKPDGHPTYDQKAIDQMVETLKSAIAALKGKDNDTTVIVPDPKPDQPDDPDTPGETQDQTQRVGGEDRIETAIQIAQKNFSQADYVVLARSDHYADALAAVPYAKLLKAPILLTSGQKMDARTLDEMIRLGAKKVIVVGGPEAIYEQTFQAAQKKVGKAERLFGLNRYETAAAIARAMAKKLGHVDTAMVVSGERYPDAMSAGVLAANRNLPILLVSAKNLPKETAQVMKELGIQKTYIAGGPAVIGQPVRQQLPKCIASFNGENRYETAALIAKELPNQNRVYLTTGLQFADALTIGVVAGASGNPLLLSDPLALSKATRSYLMTHPVREMVIVGGPMALSAAVFKAAAKLVK